MSALSHLPSVPAELDAAFAWLYGEVSGPVARSLPSPDELLAGGIGLVRVDELAGFWEEGGPGTLTTAVSGLLEGLWRGGTALIFVAARRGDDLYVGIGACGLPGAALRELVLSALPQARVRDLEGSAGASERAVLLNALRLEEQAAAIVGVPRALQVPRGTPLLERLAEATIGDWTLISFADPLPPEFLVERYARVSELHQLARDATGRTLRLSDVETQTETDVRLDLMNRLIEREEQRYLAGVRQGAFVAETWLSSPSGAGLHALGAIATATLAPTAAQPHPVRVIPGHAGGGSSASILLGAELAAVIQPPAHDVRGLRVRAWARFDAEPEPIDRAGARIRLGRVASGAVLSYPVDALTAHALVTGMTGSGKTTFVQALIAQLGGLEHPVPVLVIEPTKGDAAAAAGPGALIWRLGDPGDDSGLALNPLEVPPGIPVQTHIDLLMALFRSTFTLFAPLPQLLELAMREAYEDRGWDLAANSNPLLAVMPDHQAFPTISDLVAVCSGLVDRLGYRGEVRDNVDAALRARIGALAAGPKGAALDTDLPFPIGRLLSRPAVVNLELVGNDDEKAFLIGLFLIRLWEARRGGRSTELLHLTVLEEAHRILKRDPGSDVDGRAGPSFASETFGNLLAEVRSAGEGIVVVDQSPRKLTDDALANTALKVAFRATLKEDKAALASGLNLDEQQERALTGLPTHEAAVFWEGMDRPLRATMERQLTPPAATRLRAGAGNTRAVAPRLSDRMLAALGDIAVRARAEERPGVEARMVQRASALLPPRASSLAAEASSRARHDAADRARRARHQPLRRQDGNEGGEIRGLLLDGRFPHPACQLACPDGGCLVGELVEPAAAAARARRAESSWAELTSQRMAGEARAVAQSALIAAAPPSVASVAQRCAVVKLLDGTADELTVTEQVVSALEELET